MTGQLDRRFELAIQDEDGQRVPRAKVTFYVNGDEFATIDSTRDKNPSIQIRARKVKVSAEVCYESFVKRVVFSEGQDEETVTIPGLQRGLSILHLTDLHFGQPFHEDFFPGIRQEFFKDLERCHKTAGPWDVVLISGDLVFSGKPEQFGEFNRFLNLLLRHLRQLGSSPALLAVPGNHDLSRPPPKGGSIVKDFKKLATLSVSRGRTIWDALVRDQKSSHHRAVKKMFANYLEWWKGWEKNAKKRFVDFRTGLLPGEFAATVVKGKCKFAIVGLNSTFLQISGGNFKGKLAMHVQQFNQLLADDSEWPQTCDAAILATHQPPDWLSETCLTDVFKPFIARAGRFAMHICGHMHVAHAEVDARGGSDARRVALGRSLFGVEPIGEEGMERLFGYAAYQVSVSQLSKDGFIKAWPRSATQTQSGGWHFGPDRSFELGEDGGTLDVPSNYFRRPNWRQG
jgi:Calcineurin-like phosphoesterase